MPAQSRLLFLNLPVADLAASKAFFQGLGLTFDPKFTDDSCACMVLSDQGYVMLLAKERFADFARTPIADARETTQAIICVSAESRGDVDAFADTALASGGGAAGDPMDHGFMYGRSFTDLDGHHWEVMWMAAEALEAGPAEYAAQTA